ncbi:hypothetical protein [Nocardioides sp.]|uniref:hypothetical protein n=1 Tax=Nocardioides sp. TaxID=35761 RepID=UPI0037840248
MRTLAPTLALLLLLAACGSEGHDTVEPRGRPSATAVPAAPGVVTTRGLVTVMDTGVPELCLGAVAESWPPQCDGPRIEGWDWVDHPGTFERSGSVRWGEYRVEGLWDGTTFTYQGAIPAAAYDAAPEPAPSGAPASGRLGPAELQAVADELLRNLPGAQTAAVEGDRVVVGVTYDDGSLQDQVDAAHGAGTVVLVPALVDVEG